MRSQDRGRKHRSFDQRRFPDHSSFSIDSDKTDCMLEIPAVSHLMASGVIKNLKNVKGTGFDDIPMKLVKHLLFLVYINDLPKCLKHSHVSMYADDTSIYFTSNSISEINEAINADLAALKLWLQGNRLSLSVAKTEGMIIGSRGKLKCLASFDSVKPRFNIENDDIKMAEDTKYLGVQVDQQLKWSSLLASLTSKISRGIGILRYSKRYVPASTVKQMYKSLVDIAARFGVILASPL